MKLASKKCWGLPEFVQQRHRYGSECMWVVGVAPLPLWMYILGFDPVHAGAICLRTPIYVGVAYALCYAHAGLWVQMKSKVLSVVDVWHAPGLCPIQRIKEAPHSAEVSIFILTTTLKWRDIEAVPVASGHDLCGMAP